eukprot:jgi/Phyca11/123468/e_gw1.50.324.1
MEDFNAHQDAEVSSTFLDDTAPTLLDFIDSLENSGDLALEAVALPIRSSNFAADQLKRPAARKLLGESWQDAASRESLGRHMSGVENERLHKVLHMQVKYARKLHRMIQQQMTTAIVSQALGYRPALTDNEGRPPTDNGVVFQKLLADLDGHHGNIRNIFTVNQMEGEQECCVSIHPARGLQVRIVKSYTFPFNTNATKQAVWNVLTEKEGIDRTSKVAYNEVRACLFCANAR